jgi:hypothetical protein
MINSVEKIYYMGSSNTFKVTYDNEKIVFVPSDPNNTDYQAIQQWISEGNTVIDNGE